MIHFDATAVPQIIAIPAPQSSIVNAKLAIRKTGESEPLTLTLGTVTVVGEYYFPQVTLPQGVEQGEYEYSLQNSDGLELDCGVAMVGDYFSEDEQYNEEITYKEYEQ